MSAARHLEWENATVSPTRVCVPLDGTPDDYWLDRFHQARTEAKQLRTRRNLPHLQIELRDREIAASEIPEGEHDRVRELLEALVASANRAPRSRYPTGVRLTG